MAHDQLAAMSELFKIIMAGRHSTTRHGAFKMAAGRAR
jgi:hypothetical protein